jgi:trafficking protein particle complex subunit 9
MVTGISRSLIASVVAQAHGPWLLHLGPGERIVVLESMAGIYACLGYKRKEAYILREILGCVMDLLVCGREEVETTSSDVVHDNAGLGIQGAGVGEPRFGVPDNVGIRLSENTNGNESILKLLKYISKVVGVNLETVSFVDDDTSNIGSHNSKPRSSTEIEWEDEKTGALGDPYGWPELQVGVIREAVAVAEALPGSSMQTYYKFMYSH